MSETVEFTHVIFDDRGIGNSHKRALAIVVGIADGHTTELHSHRLPAIHIKDLPTVERLKGFMSVREFERVFGEFRGMTDGRSDPKGGMHTTADWTGFSLQADGSVRVVSAFLHLLHRGITTSIEGGHFREGVFKATGQSPQLEPR